jgi:hypothetical protein
MSIVLLLTLSLVVSLVVSVIVSLVVALIAVLITILVIRWRAAESAVSRGSRMVKMRIRSGCRPRATHRKSLGNHRSNDMEHGLRLRKGLGDRCCLGGWMDGKSSSGSRGQSRRMDNDVRVCNRGGDQDRYNQETQKKDYALIEDRSRRHGNGGRGRRRRLRKNDSERSVGIDLPTKSDIPNARSHLRMENRTVISGKSAGCTKWRLHRSC